MLSPALPPPASEKKGHSHNYRLTIWFPFLTVRAPRPLAPLPTLTFIQHGRSFALLFRISDQGNQLAREARKVSLLSGHAAVKTHHRLTRAVAALRAFSRRRIGRPAAVVVTDTTSDENLPAQRPPELAPSPSPFTSTQVQPLAAEAVYSVLSHLHDNTPLLASSPMNRSFSTDGSNCGVPSEDEAGSSIAAHDNDVVAPDNGGGDSHSTTTSGSSDGNPLLDAWAAASAAEANNRIDHAAAEAAAKSAAASASVAAEGAALAEEKTLVEALREVRGALMDGREDATGHGEEVGRVAAGVGLAPALLGALRALKIRRDEGDGGGGGGSASNGLDLAKQVKRGFPIWEENWLDFVVDVVLSCSPRTRCIAFWLVCIVQLRYNPRWFCLPRLSVLDGQRLPTVRWQEVRMRHDGSQRDFRVHFYCIAARFSFAALHPLGCAATQHPTFLQRRRPFSPALACSRFDQALSPEPMNRSIAHTRFIYV